MKVTCPRLRRPELLHLRFCTLSLPREHHPVPASLAAAACYDPPSFSGVQYATLIGPLRGSPGRFPPPGRSPDSGRSHLQRRLRPPDPGLRLRGGRAVRVRDVRGRCLLHVRLHGHVQVVQPSGIGGNLHRDTERPGSRQRVRRRQLRGVLLGVAGQHLLGTSRCVGSAGLVRRGRGVPFDRDGVRCLGRLGSGRVLRRVLPNRLPSAELCHLPWHPRRHLQLHPGLHSTVSTS
jgi:hypothetical protein